MAPRGELRAAIVAGNAVLQQGLQSILKRLGIAVAGHAGSVREAVATVPSLASDILFLEAELLSGAEPALCARLKAVTDGVPVIVVSVSAEPGYVFRAVEIGASAYLCHDLGEAGLQLAVDAVLRTHVLLDQRAFACLCRALAVSEARRCELAPTLTPREWEVLECLAQGQGYQEIAEGLGMAPATVRTHAARIYKKLGISGAEEVIHWARGHGLT